MVISTMTLLNRTARKFNLDSYSKHPDWWVEAAAV
jgi:hypothetical protein